MPESLYAVPATDRQEWDRWLEPAAHDFYHTSTYHQFSEASGEGEGWLAICGTRDRYLAWPYLLRRVGQESDLCDLTSVYGYAGPLAHGCGDGDPFLSRARQRIAKLWRSQNVISAFTRFHPVLENQRWAAGTRLTQGGETVSIDLTHSEAENWHDYQASLRNRINRGRRLGLVTEIDESWLHLEDFVRFYHAAMTRNRAAGWYFFPIDYFQRLKRALGAHALLMTTRLDSRIAAAAIIIEYRGIVQNHFCMNNEDCLDLAPSKVLLDDVRRWAKARGNRVFHLGGGRGGTTDSLFVFKSAFSSVRHTFYTGRWVLVPTLYQLLCQNHAAAAGNFFPAYRAPDVSALRAGSRNSGA